jgi:hypothetical protein
LEEGKKKKEEEEEAERKKVMLQKTNFTLMEKLFNIPTPPALFAAAAADGLSRSSSHRG